VKAKPLMMIAIYWIGVSLALVQYLMFLLSATPVGIAIVSILSVGLMIAGLFGFHSKKVGIYPRLLWTGLTLCFVIGVCAVQSQAGDQSLAGDFFSAETVAKILFGISFPLVLIAYYYGSIIIDERNGTDTNGNMPGSKDWNETLREHATGFVPVWLTTIICLIALIHLNQFHLLFSYTMVPNKELLKRDPSIGASTFHRLPIPTQILTRESVLLVPAILYTLLGIVPKLRRRVISAGPWMALFLALTFIGVTCLPFLDVEDVRAKGAKESVPEWFQSGYYGRK